ncbi:putative tail protein [Pseudomonas phage PhL_UNISO_PA-DSM_ph0041x]|nr:putative tail protein [Pseudomonas phage PhL_UNISO_PA-DSM_ph0041x]
MKFDEYSTKSQTWLKSFLSRPLDFLSLIKKREGLVLQWYKDSLGYWTGGYGHLQRPGEDGPITLARAETWLENDSKAAYDAAQRQVSELPFCTPELFDALVSVNFQLGTAWTKKFPKTWSLLKAGEFDRAAWEAEDSAWAKQTPVRVRDLQRALWRASTIGSTVN